MPGIALADHFQGRCTKLQVECTHGIRGVNLVEHVQRQRPLQSADGPRSDKLAAVVVEIDFHPAGGKLTGFPGLLVQGLDLLGRQGRIVDLQVIERAQEMLAAYMPVHRRSLAGKKNVGFRVPEVVVRRVLHLRRELSLFEQLQAGRITGTNKGHVPPGLALGCRREHGCRHRFTSPHTDAITTNNKALVTRFLGIGISPRQGDTLPCRERPQTQGEITAGCADKIQLGADVHILDHAVEGHRVTRPGRNPGQAHARHPMVGPVISLVGGIDAIHVAEQFPGALRPIAFGHGRIQLGNDLFGDLALVVLDVHSHGPVQGPRQPLEVDGIVHNNMGKGIVRGVKFLVQHLETRLDEPVNRGMRLAALDRLRLLEQPSRGIDPTQLKQGKGPGQARLLVKDARRRVVHDLPGDLVQFLKLLGKQQALEQQGHVVQEVVGNIGVG